MSVFSVLAMIDIEHGKAGPAASVDRLYWPLFPAHTAKVTEDSAFHKM
jgi:hypothetical protein